jgi:hypothetical protein
MQNETFGIEAEASKSDGIDGKGGVWRAYAYRESLGHPNVYYDLFGRAVPHW